LLKSQTYIVLDIGSGLTKVGFGGKREPVYIFPTIVGIRKRNVFSPFSEIPDVCFGKDVMNKRILFDIHRPVSRGLIKEWDMWKLLVQYSLKIVGVKPDKSCLIVPYDLNTPKEQRIRMAEILLEELEIGGIYFPLTSLLILYATGEETGIILDIGDGKTTLCLVKEGIPLFDCSTRIDLGGIDITLQLLQLLRDKGIDVSLDHIDLISEIKEKYCYVAVNVKKELEKAKKLTKVIEEKVTLPDGTEISLVEERFLAPEILFNPTQYGIPSKGLHEILYESLVKCADDLKLKAIENIILSGGTALTPGLSLRLKTEIEKVLLEEFREKLKVKRLRNSIIAPWYGGSVLTKIQDFHKYIITKKEWRKLGEQAILSMI